MRAAALPVGGLFGDALAGREEPQGREHRIAHKIFVGNLDFALQEAAVEDLFSQVGTVVEVFFPRDRATGRPRGLAFVEFDDAASVAEAIERFDGYELSGRKLRVNEAEAKRPRERFADEPRDAPQRPSKPKGSRRNLRRRKRSL